MKKLTFLIALFGILIFPTVTLAAWWNPLTWFNNWAFISNNKTEILESRINDLEQKIAESNKPEESTQKVLQPEGVKEEVKVESKESKK